MKRERGKERNDGVRWRKQQIGTSRCHRWDERLQCCSRGELRIEWNFYNYWTSFCRLWSPLQHSRFSLTFFSEIRTKMKPNSHLITNKSRKHQEPKNKNIGINKNNVFKILYWNTHERILERNAGRKQTKRNSGKRARERECEGSEISSSYRFGGEVSACVCEEEKRGDARVFMEGHEQGQESGDSYKYSGT